MSRSGAQPKLTADEAWQGFTDPVTGPQTFGSRAEWQKFMGNINNSGNIDAQVAEQVQLQLAAFLKDQQVGNGGSPVDFSGGGSARRVAARAATAPGARLNDVGFDSFGHLFQAATSQHPDGDVAAKLSRLSNAFGSDTPADGGFLIPETYRSDIQTVALESAVVRPRATVIPMGSLRSVIPTNDSTSNTSSTFGGFVSYWTQEAAQLQKSSAKFARVVLEAKKLTIYGEVPNELMADSPGLDAFLRMALPASVAFGEDAAFLAGSGVGEPLGVLGCPAMITVDAGTASHIKWLDIVGMYARMLPSSLNRAVWVASPSAVPDLLTLAFREAGDTAGTPALIGIGNGASAPPTSILGRPLVITEKAPALGSANPLSFIDFSYYLVGDRQQMALRTSEDFKFDTDETAIRVIERVDGRPWLQTPITPHNSGDTLSPYVGLSAT